jgi:hypothetical protein
MVTEQENIKNVYLILYNIILKLLCFSVMEILCVMLYVICCSYSVHYEEFSMPGCDAWHMFTKVSEERVTHVETRNPRVEAGSNTSTVTLRVVRGDEKGSLKSETVKYGCESQGTRTRERLRWQGPAAFTKDRPVLSSERAPHKSKTVIVK